MRRDLKTLLCALPLAVALTACGSGQSDSGSTSQGGFEWGNVEAVDSARAGAPKPIASEPEISAACSADKSPTIAAIKKAGVLHWGIGISPPFGFTGPSGKWQGVDSENAAELANILGVKPDVVPYDYSLMTTALQSKKADIVGAQLFVTPDRQKVIDFSDAYYKSGQVFYVLKSSPYQSIDDLNVSGIRFVFGTGGAQGDIAKKYIPKATQQQVPLQGQLIPYQFIATGRADVTMGESGAYPVLAEKFTNPPIVAIGKAGRIDPGVPSADDVLDPFDVAFGLPKDDAGWKSCVDAWVNKEGSDGGTISERVNYWLNNQDKANG
jgi:ABC-type amino acid transport substrate-binding protein